MHAQQTGSNSQEQQGFFKPTLKVIHSQQQQKYNLKVTPPQGNSLSNIPRPTQFQIRCLINSPINQSFCPIHFFNSQNSNQILHSISITKNKQKKWNSLQQKYRKNQDYVLKYTRQQKQFLSCNDNYYIENFTPLTHLTDYHPSNYQVLNQSQDKNLVQSSRNNDEPKNKSNQQQNLFISFDSQFQCGNLNYAFQNIFKKDILQFDLIIQNDTNTKGYNQWFCFKVKSNHPKQLKVCLNIVNFIKKKSMFIDGVKPVAYSLQHPQKGWFSIGDQIQYKKSGVYREVGDPPKLKSYYTLSWKMILKPFQRIIIALNYPYSYSNVINYIKKLEQQFQDIQIKNHYLAYSHCNNIIPLIRIIKPNITYNKKIVLLGRQHPGQTVGSFVLQGFLTNILKNNKLTNKYQIIVIPMLNPDGVIYGNFRTNLSGFDLNRQWGNPDKFLHPQVYYLLKFLKQQQNIQMVLDFHGHSKKSGCFIFACTGQPISSYRLFPYLVSKNSKYFSLPDCTFNNSPSKQKTARLTLFRHLQHHKIYTIQTSFFCYTNQNGQKIRYSIKDLLNIGQQISQTTEVFLMNKKQVQIAEKQVKQKNYLFQQWLFSSSKQCDSQSNPSQDQLTPLQRLQKVIIPLQNKKSKLIFKNKKKKEKVESQQKKIKPSTSQKKSPQKVQIQKKMPSPVAIIITKKVKRQIPPRAQGEKTQTSENKKIEQQWKSQKIKPLIYPVGVRAQKQHKKMEKIQNLKSQTIVSNLFNTSNYYSAYSKVQKTQSKAQKYLIRQKIIQQSEIKQIKINQRSSKQSNTEQITKKYTRKNILSVPPLQTMASINSYGNRKQRFIRSISKFGDQDFKGIYEENIVSRTQALRNCQRKMSQISKDQPFITFSKQLIQQKQLQS